MKTETVIYSHNNISFKGYLAYPASASKKNPALLVCPTWMGLNEQICSKCEELAELGYLTLGVDFFGKGVVAKDHLEAEKLTAPLLKDRQLLVDRLNTALELLKAHPAAEPAKVCAIGFCFGGGAALELALSGADLRGVVSFHGKLGDLSLTPAPKISTSILVLHGYKDAMVSEQSLLDFKKKMSGLGLDWQVVTYGDAMHAFTNPNANTPELSLQFHQKSSDRAWLAMKNFLEETF